MSELKTMRKRVRVACVGYTNAWPLTRHLDPLRFEEGVVLRGSVTLRY